VPSTHYRYFEDKILQSSQLSLVLTVKQNNQETEHRKYSTRMALSRVYTLPRLLMLQNCYY